MDTIGERLARSREMRGLSTRQLADKVGCTYQAILKIESGETVRTRFLPEIAAALGVRAEWLRTGFGPKEEESEINPELFIFVPFYSEAPASAGAGAEPESEESYTSIAFRSNWIGAMGLDSRRLAMVPAVGDSMLPRIQDGDTLLVDLRASRQPPKSGGIYLLRHPSEGLRVKRLVCDYTGAWTIVSDNPLAGGPPQPVANMDGVAIRGRVVWVGGKV